MNSLKALLIGCLLMPGVALVGCGGPDGSVAKKADMENPANRIDQPGMGPGFGTASKEGKGASKK